MLFRVIKMKIPHLHKWKTLSLEAKVGEEKMEVGKVEFRYCERCNEIDRKSLNKACEEARDRYFKMIGGG